MEGVFEDITTPSRWVDAWHEADPNDQQIALLSLLLVANVYRSIFQKYRDARTISAVYAFCTGGISAKFFQMGFNFSGIEFAAECLGFIILTIIGPGKRSAGSQKH